MKLAEDLTEEERQTIREGLNEEGKAVFDILTKPEPELTEKERDQVKVVARTLLQTLKDEKFVLDWRSYAQKLVTAIIRRRFEVA